MTKEEFKSLLRTKEESAFDYLTRVVPLYQSLTSGYKLDSNTDLSMMLDEFQRSRFEDAVMENIFIVVRIQCNQHYDKIRDVVEYDDYCAIGVGVVLRYLSRYDSSKGGFYTFLQPYMKRVMSEAIQQSWNLNRFDQKMVKLIKGIIKDIADNCRRTPESIKKEEIAFELQKMDIPNPMNKVEKYLPIIKGNVSVDDFDPNIYVPEDLRKEFEFEKVVASDVKTYLSEFLDGLSEVDRFLLLMKFDARYKDFLYKDIAKHYLFVKLCLADKKAFKHVDENGVETTFMDNRKKAIKKRLKEFGDYIVEEGYEDEMIKLLKDIVYDEAKDFFDAVYVKYCDE